MLRSHPFFLQLGGYALARIIESWMRTLNYRIDYHDPSVDPVNRCYCGPGVYLFWHEYIPFPFYLRPRCRVAMLVSQHRDAELLSYAAKYSGFETVRGSTTRGGVVALRTLMQKGKGLNLAITPDGPQGPRRKLAPGPIFLASKLRLPIILMGFGYERPWRYRRAWDHFAIPRPGSRARAIFSSPIYIPSKLDRDALEHYRGSIEIQLNAISDESEDWATSGTSRPNEVPLYRSPAFWQHLVQRESCESLEQQLSNPTLRFYPPSA